MNNFILNQYIYILMCAWYWTRLLVTYQGNGARRVVSLHHLCFSPLQRLTREFKYETFPGQWVPLNREQGQRRQQGQRRLPTQDWLDLFVCFSTREKRMVVTLYPRFVSYCEYRISSLKFFSFSSQGHESPPSLTPSHQPAPFTP